MAEHTSSKQRRLWLILSGALVAALVSLLVLQWDNPARANEQSGSGNETTSERSSGSFEEDLTEAVGKDGFQAQIVGGTPVPNGKYPFMAVLLVRNTDGSTSLCGGSLIDRDSVLTAGHCLVDAFEVDLAVGRTVISKRQGQVRENNRVFFLHPRFDLSNNFSYDAAVIKLNSAVSGIKPIKLSTASQDNLEKPGRKLTVAGWGTTSEGGNTSDRMREVSVPVVSDAKAKTAYSSLSPQLRYFPNLMVAAGQQGKDSCQGDSGGPLFKPGTTRTQVGIVSYGQGCARAAFPGVYTEVNSSGIRSFIVKAAQQ